MQIGVLGSGVTAQTIGSKMVQLGHEVMLGSREEANPASVAWAKEEGGQHALYGTFMNAAKFGEIVFNCTLGLGLYGCSPAGRGRKLKRQDSDRYCQSSRTASDDMWTLTICNDRFPGRANSEASSQKQKSSKPSIQSMQTSWLTRKNCTKKPASLSAGMISKPRRQWSAS